MTRLAPCQNGRRLFPESTRKSMVTSHFGAKFPSCPWSDASKDVGNSYVGHLVPAKRENSAPPPLPNSDSAGGKIIHKSHLGKTRFYADDSFFLREMLAAFSFTMHS
ncbi:hypothetical protein CEXT_747541 [Caerostris extrusa]|uniref:Uncharacterized protein n=1 Tax=Caerostris extrusa TaxID=172846 RepID=A0AAV4T8V4_CAEEX|nr:hypothetical protein CEXT_747541 [Caerostris extrusa]